MTIAGMRQYLKNEHAAASKRAKLIGFKGKTRYIKALEAAIRAFNHGSKVGYWIDPTMIPDNINGHLHGECSVCHKVRIIDNYCSNCGSRMEDKK